MRSAPAVAILALALTALPPVRAMAIQGCTLRDPDRDIRRLFPEATDYRSFFIAVADRGGEDLQRKLAQRLGHALDPVYEAIDVPYAYYQVLEGKQIIGYVAGVNQKGRYGGIQLILAVDPRGQILSLYYQKLSTPERKQFIATGFTDQFKGLTLADFYYHAGYERLGLKRKEDRVAAIAAPADSDAARHDFAATLRGVMKDLILLDLFWLEDRNGPVFDEVQRIVEQKGAGR